MWIGFIHMYTTQAGLNNLDDGIGMTGWAKDSPARPKSASIHISLPRHMIAEIKDDGTYQVKPKLEWDY